MKMYIQVYITDVARKSFHKYINFNFLKQYINYYVSHKCINTKISTLPLRSWAQIISAANIEQLAGIMR